MYVMESRKAAFIHIPKTGGKAIARYIVWPLGCERHGGRPRHVGYIPNVVPEDWFIFAFVRNPYARMVSLYRQRWLESKNFRDKNPRLSVFLKKTLEDYERFPKPLAQTEFLAPCVEVFRYEKFNESIAEICRRLEIPVPEMRLDKNSNYFGTYDWRKVVDEDSVVIINERFSRDFEQLGYSKMTFRKIQRTGTQ